MEQKPVRRVFLITPESTTEATRRYREACERDSLLRGEAPLPHFQIGKAGGVPDEPLARAKHAWQNSADAAVRYADFGVSPGMLREWDRAIARGQTVEERTLDGYLASTMGTKLIVGLAAKNGAGKGTCAKILRQCAENERFYPYGFEVDVLRTSDDIFSCLKRYLLESSRRHAQIFVKVMEKAFGKGLVSNAMRERLLQSPAKLAMMDGVRLMTDVDMFRAINGAHDCHGRRVRSFIVYIDTDPALRFGRMRSRKEKSGETFMTQEQFKKEDNAYTERPIAKIKPLADVVIENNGSPEEFEAQVQAYWNESLRCFYAPGTSSD